MGLITMSERDLQRIEVLSKVVDGRMSTVRAAHVLAIGTRQVQRLINCIEATGAASIIRVSKACAIVLLPEPGNLPKTNGHWPIADILSNDEPLIIIESLHRIWVILTVWRVLVLNEDIDRSKQEYRH